MTINWVEPAPAKINLALHITGQRGDGYHLIDSLVVFTALGDTITVEPSDQDQLTISGPFEAGLRLEQENLVVKARSFLRAQFPSATSSPVHMSLDKHLPVSSGIGGGSADASAALRALARHWDVPLSEVTYCKLAQLGADIPMCLVSRPLMARGVGEIIEPLTPPFPTLHMVVVNCGAAVSTPDVFKRLHPKDNAPLSPLPAFLSLDEIISYLQISRNDLSNPALEIAPKIDDSLKALAKSGAEFCRMSGSGATCFGLFSTPRKAHDAAKLIAQSEPDWFVRATETQELETKIHATG